MRDKMRNKKTAAVIVIVLVLSAALWVARGRKGGVAENGGHVMRPYYGDISLVVNTTGVVEPQNRLEIKPPIGGRVEEIFVAEGDRVKAGQTLALISSTDRAALLDSARNKGEESLRHWQEVYKPIPLIAPITGDVIVRAVEPGQTVTANDAVVVISDRLIVKANVDETDIGRVDIGQRVDITIDAYSDVTYQGVVDHISYESTVVNNVTIYAVDIAFLDAVPRVCRSGMSVSVDIVERSVTGALLLPEASLLRRGRETFVLLREAGAKEPVERRVETGVSDGSAVEIVSGLDGDDEVWVEQGAALAPREKRNENGNPFMPQPPHERNRSNR